MPEIQPSGKARWRRLQHRLSEFLPELFGSVSTRANFEAYSWGPRQSLLARGLYESIFFLRLLSPLQWVKYLKRQHDRLEVEREKKRTHHSSLEAKPRPDFHAAWSEVYLIVILCLSILFWFFSRHYQLQTPNFTVRHPRIHGFIDGVAIFFLIESLLWTLYYMALRPLVERRQLNLFDEAEYLVSLPVALLTQVFLLSGLWRKDFVSIGLLLLNISYGSVSQTAHNSLHWNSPNTRAQLLFGTLLGQTYLVIILASLIRIVPPLQVRKRPTITVIGYGDVAQKRILPALMEVYKPRQIAVATDTLTDEEAFRLNSLGIRYKAVRRIGAPSNCPEPMSDEDEAKNILKIASWVSSHSRFAIIAVPTHSHFAYMLALSRHATRYAVEKPLVGTEAELRSIRKPEFAEIFEKAFVLSYYWLEKSLPLNYLISLNPLYRPLIEFKQPGAKNLSHTLDAKEQFIPARAIEAYLSRLGALSEITVELLEPGEEKTRYWTELPGNGGMALETLIHPLTLVINLARRWNAYDVKAGLWDAPPTTLWRKNLERAAKVREWTNGQEIGATYVEITGHLTGGARVHISCGKYVVEEARRFLVAEYHNGWITCDMTDDNMTARVFLKHGDEVDCVVEATNTITTPAQRIGASQGFTKYQQQIDLVNTFFLDGWGGIRFDDYPSQLDVLQEIFALTKTTSPEDQIAADDDVLDRRRIRRARMIQPDLN